MVASAAGEEGVEYSMVLLFFAGRMGDCCAFPDLLLEPEEECEALAVPLRFDFLRAAAAARLMVRENMELSAGVWLGKNELMATCA